MNVSAFFVLLTLSHPLDTGSHFDMLCELARNICWQKGILGHVGGEALSKINYKALNEAPNARSQHFFRKSTDHAQSH